MQLSVALFQLFPTTVDYTVFAHYFEQYLPQKCRKTSIELTRKNFQKNWTISQTVPDILVTSLTIKKVWPLCETLFPILFIE